MGYIYICKMQYEGKSYYKIGQTHNLGKRELALRTANPFLTMIAKKVSIHYKKEEKEIHRVLKDCHFNLEWYELHDERFQELFKTYNFEEYLEKEKAENIWKAREQMRARHTETKGTADQFYYHIFKKLVKSKNGRFVYRWYFYYFGQDGHQVQRVCRGCGSRKEAEDYIRNLK
jgi:hypothetical protein